jgi:hypothetical protein
LNLRVRDAIKFPWSFNLPSPLPRPRFGNRPSLFRLGRRITEISDRDLNFFCCSIAVMKQEVASAIRELGFPFPFLLHFHFHFCSAVEFGGSQNPGIGCIMSPIPRPCFVSTFYLSFIPSIRTWLLDFHLHLYAIDDSETAGNPTSTLADAAGYIIHLWLMPMSTDILSTLRYTLTPSLIMTCACTSKSN